MTQTTTSGTGENPPVANDRLGLFAILAGTAFIAWTGIFVRFTDVGPLTSAAWRMILAVPALMIWMRLMRRAADRNGEPVGRTSIVALALPIIAAGLAFAADVGAFHYSLTGTSIANASFIGNIAPILAVVGGTAFFGEHPERRVWAALALALTGGWVMAGMVSPADVRAGDIWALVAAISYCSYLLVIKRLRRSLDGPAATMWSALVSAIVLTSAALVLETPFLPHTLVGWGVVFGIGIGSHALGQGLTSIAMGRLPVGVIATVILAQPPISALLAYGIVGEHINLYQACGGAIILIALVLARPR